MNYRTFGEDGQWTIVKGPEIGKSCWQMNAFNSIFDVRVTVFPTKQGCSSHRPGERDIKLEIQIPCDHARLFGTLSIPTAVYGKGHGWNQTAWEDGLAEIVADAIEVWGREHSEECGNTFALVARRIRGEKKMLHLNNDDTVLRGNLWHNGPQFDRKVSVLGNIFREGATREEVLCTFRVPKTQYPQDQTNPPAKLAELHPLWCERLNELVLEYIEELAKYAVGDQRIQTFLTLITKTSEAKSQWRQTVRRIQEKLARVPEEQRPQLIEGLVRLQNELGLTIT